MDACHDKALAAQVATQISSSTPEQTKTIYQWAQVGCQMSTTTAAMYDKTVTVVTTESCRSDPHSPNSTYASEFVVEVDNHAHAAPC